MSINELDEVYKATGHEINNIQLAKLTLVIRKELDKMKLGDKQHFRYWTIGKYLKEVTDKKLYKNDFSSFEEYTRTMLKNMSKGSAYRFIEIASKMYTKDGKQFLEDKGYFFDIGKLAALKALEGEYTTPEIVRDFVLANGIVPDTEIKEIKKIVNEHKHPETSTTKPSQSKCDKKSSAKWTQPIALDSGFKAILNEFYAALTAKAESLMKALAPIVDSDLLMSMSYVIKHYIRNMYKHKEPTPDNASRYPNDNYPIPVIRLSDLCEVEIYTDVISVFTRLKSADVKKLDFSRLTGYSFEAYGYDGGRLMDFSDGKATLQETKDNILKSNTEVADFYFDFPFDCDESEILTLATLLHDEGFFF